MKSEILIVISVLLLCLSNEVISLAVFTGWGGYAICMLLKCMIEGGYY